MKIDEAQLRRATELVSFLASEYYEEIPLRIHTRGTDNQSRIGAPPFAPEFIKWIDAGSDDERYKDKRARQRGEYTSHDHRQRVTRVMREIRRVAPREYFVLSLATTKAMSVGQIATAMNDRAEQRGLEERYTVNDVTALLLLALSKAVAWY